MGAVKHCLFQTGHGLSAGTYKGVLRDMYAVLGRDGNMCCSDGAVLLQGGLSWLKGTAIDNNDNDVWFSRDMSPDNVSCPMLVTPNCPSLPPSRNSTVLNSKVVSVTIKPTPGSLSTPVEVQFSHLYNVSDLSHLTL